jgi:predicted nucleotidyltransferase
LIKGNNYDNQEKIDEAKQRLIKMYQPLEIYIFGSYAWGTPDEESDLDLAVVVDSYNEDEKHALLVEGHKALFGLRLSKDILLYSKEEFDFFSEDITRLTYKIKHEGKKIYPRPQ